MFQRPGDIVASVRQGSVDFGITGMDVFSEKGGDDKAVLVLHDELGFAHCTLTLAVPGSWRNITNLADLGGRAKILAKGGKPIRIATKYPELTKQFLDNHQITPHKLIKTEGTLEIAPSIGTADLIADLVSSGTTLRDNHLRALTDGAILDSQACLIANLANLKGRPAVLSAALQLLEYIEAHLRAENSYLVLANVRGESSEDVAGKLGEQTSLAGLQGPTISPVIPPNGHLRESNWFAINIVVSKSNLSQAITELRMIGGSGVIVSPLTYIFEEEPERCQRLMEALGTQVQTKNL
jgi:ATP phosphoribosyltransferase